MKIKFILLFLIVNLSKLAVNTMRYSGDPKGKNVASTSGGENVLNPAQGQHSGVTKHKNVASASNCGEDLTEKDVEIVSCQFILDEFDQLFNEFESIKAKLNAEKATLEALQHMSDENKEKFLKSMLYAENELEQLKNLRDQIKKVLFYIDAQSMSPLFTEIDEYAKLNWDQFKVGSECAKYGAGFEELLDLRIKMSTFLEEIKFEILRGQKLEPFEAVAEMFEEQNEINLIDEFALRMFREDRIFKTMKTGMENFNKRAREALTRKFIAMQNIDNAHLAENLPPAFKNFYNDILTIRWEEIIAKSLDLRLLHEEMHGITDDGLKNWVEKLNNIAVKIENYSRIVCGENGIIGKHIKPLTEGLKLPLSMVPQQELYKDLHTVEGKYKDLHTAFLLYHASSELHKVIQNIGISMESVAKTDHQYAHSIGDLFKIPENFEHLIKAWLLAQEYVKKDIDMRIVDQIQQDLEMPKFLEQQYEQNRSRWSRRATIQFGAARVLLAYARLNKFYNIHYTFDNFKRNPDFFFNINENNSETFKMTYAEKVKELDVNQEHQKERFPSLLCPAIYKLFVQESNSNKK